MPAPPCDIDCRCGKHRSRSGQFQPPCEQGCDCRKHVRAPEHNARIAISCALTVEAKKRAGEKVNQHG